MKKYVPDIVVILWYCLVTVAFFWFRMRVIGTHYSMPDVDTDWALWQYAMSFFRFWQIPNLDVNSFIAYPFWFDFLKLPVYSLVYDIGNIFYRLLWWSTYDLLFMSNVWALIQYPLSWYVMYILALKFTTNKYIAYISWLLFAFSFHNVLYARNSLSINRLFLIPLYYNTFIHYISVPTKRNLILSAFTLAIIFICNPYRAFYSIIFTPFLWCISKDRILIYAKKLLNYYTISLVILLSININFIVQQANIQFDRANIDISGRWFVPRKQLTEMKSLFTRANLLPSSEWFIEYGVWLWVIWLVVFVVSLFFIKKMHRREYHIFVLCFLLAVVLCAYSPVTFWINELFFKIFPMFKSISRFNIYATLFLSLLFAVAVDNFYYVFRKKYTISKNVQFWLCILCMIIIYFDSTPLGAKTRLHTTNFTSLERLYKPLQDDATVQVIAGYPMSLYGSSAKWWTAPTYELLGQMVHRKKLVGWLDPFNPRASARYQSIADISDPQTIEKLANYRVDTLIIYNDIIDFYAQNTTGLNSQQINKILQSDSRLWYAGTRSEPRDDIEYGAWKDRSQNISVYQIKSVMKQNNSNPKTVMEGDHAMEFQKVLPRKYQLKIKNITGDVVVKLRVPFDTWWSVYSEPYRASRDCEKWLYFNTVLQCPTTDSWISPLDLKYLLRDEIPSSHTIAYEYANQRVITRKELSRLGSGYFHKNVDGSIDVEMTLYLTSQLWYYIWYMISLGTIGWLLLWLYLHRRDTQIWPTFTSKNLNE